MPYLGSTVFFASLCVAGLVAITSCLVLVRALSPSFVERARLRWARRPATTVLLGGVLGGLATVVGLVLLSAGPGGAKLAGFLVLGAAVTVALVGMTGLAALVGDGLSSPRDEGREWMRVLKGAVVLELACLLPFVGQLVLAPIALLGGVGAAAHALVAPLFARRAPDAQATASATDASA